MFRVLGWILLAIAALFALGAIVELSGLPAQMADDGRAPTLAGLTRYLEGPALFTIAALLFALLGRRFLMRARYKAARRARAARVEKMTDLFS